MSEFKTNKISPRSGTTQTIGDSGDSVSTSSGSTINNAGTITTAGITGGTINNTTGSIYLRGEVDWQPSDIKTASFTATDNQGFFVNTTSGQITVTLPASPSAGDVVGIKDYANTFDTNKCILNANGNKIQGSTTNFNITVEGSSIIIIYVDATQGWVITDASKAADISQQALYTVATGGTITTCGNFKIHTFTGPGTFCVSQIGNCVGGPSNVDYLVIAGGGGGGKDRGGGGGAGGYRESHLTATSGPYTASPLATPTSLPVSVQAYPITVGGGGTGAADSSPDASAGANSIFSSITSSGGGSGGNNGSNPNDGGPGGSGGGADGVDFTQRTGGTGNTPPVSPAQGQNGGPNGPCGTWSGGGGGGAASAGGAASGTSQPSNNGGNGGNGTTTSISGSPVTRAGGGGGSNFRIGCGTAGSAGPGGGGSGTGGNTAPSGTNNTGGGGGGSGNTPAPGSPNPRTGGNGGSGIVIIRYKYQN